ncbi:hypothetical protein [Aliikangiella sp. IMCC44359]|uniref:hypothetical protein n=1 Tax=Aliikangiella sp. IMCC44359 TaxID=3459125 RepID=UPI00403AD9CA
MPTWCHQTGRGPNGHPGSPGSVPARNTAGVSGHVGNVEFPEFSADSFASSYDFSFLNMVMHESELLYLNDNIKEAAVRLLWLLDLLENATNFKQETADILMPGQPSTDQSIQNNLLSKRIKILLTQLSQGLGYYGHPKNFVPLTSITVYEENIETLLPIANDIEKAFAKYYDKQQSDIEKRKAIAVAISSLELKTNGLQQQSAQLIKEIAVSRDQVSDLLTEQLVLKRRVDAAREAFKEAVSREAACGFTDVLKAAGAIAAIASGFGSVVAGVAALGEVGSMMEASKSLKDWKKTGEYIVKHGKVVSGGIDKISSGYNDIKGVLEEERDAAKLIMAEEEFEEAVKKFEHIEEAREYRKLMRQYLANIRLRNEKILEIDSKITRVYEIESEMSGLEFELTATKSRHLEVFNPRLAEHYIFFDRALARAKSELIRAIVMAHKALAYWSLNRNVLPTNLYDRSVDQIKSYYSDFKATRLRLMEERNASPGPLEVRHIIIDKEEDPDLFATFIETGRFTFKLDEMSSEFRFYSNVLVNQANVSIELTGANNSRKTVFLRHHGDPVFVDNLGDNHSFSHRPRLRLGTLDRENNQTNIKLGGSDSYAFLSPLASWSVMMEFETLNGELLEGDDEVLERKKVTRINILFKGVGDARYDGY